MLIFNNWDLKGFPYLALSSTTTNETFLYLETHNQVISNFLSFCNFCIYSSSSIDLFDRNNKPVPGPGNYSRLNDLQSGPHPPSQVGVTVGEPPSIDSPPTQDGINSISSPASQYSGTPQKRVPGKLAMCKSCGHLSEDLLTCMRCRRKYTVTSTHAITIMLQQQDASSTNILETFRSLE